jgi:hypothetical protein
MVYLIDREEDPPETKDRAFIELGFVSSGVRAYVSKFVGIGEIHD